MTQNPEFDKAFPHLAQNKPSTKISRDLGEKDFVKSLFGHQRAIPEKTYEESVTQNERKFAEGYRSPQGPLKYMDQAEKDKIHLEIDKHLQELEDTGLSRDELLHDGKIGGIPLARDPFFQFIKKNKLARETLI